MAHPTQITIGDLEKLEALMKRGGKLNTRADQEIGLAKNDEFIRWQGDWDTWQIDKENTSLPDNAKIPGFPSDIDGKYYYQLEFNGPYFSSDDLSEITTEQKGSVRPYGDVSDLEITLVSEWFRTHQPTAPSRVPMFTEFFIQDISQDKDRTPAGDRDGAPVEQAENIQGIMQDLNYGLEKLGVKLNNSDDWIHINDFNGDKANKLWEQDDICSEDNIYANRTFLYWKGDGTNDYTVSFSYRNTSTGQRYEDYWLVYLSLPEGSDNPVCHGWYLGFDFDDTGQNFNYEGDGYYNNWIVKLSPANPNFRVEYPTPAYNKHRRIMCEDLGNTNDFDFNDLVFDVYYTGTKEEGYEAHITVQAVGGTLPIYIGKPSDDNSNEAHHILGAEANSDGKYDPIINFGGNRTTEDGDITIGDLTDTDPNYIEIYVIDETNQAGRILTLPNDKGGKFEKPGDAAPQKICVPYGTPWTYEHQQIEELYPHFRDWVEHHGNTWWIDEEDTEDTEYTGLKWIDETTNRKSVNIDEGETTTVSFQSDEFGHITASGYNSAIIKVTMTNSSISVEGLQRGSTTVTLTQAETGETLLLEVTVGDTGEGKEIFLTEDDHNPNGTHDAYRNHEYTISSDKFNGYNSDIIITFILSKSSNIALYCNSNQDKKEEDWTSAGGSVTFSLTYDEYKGGVIFMSAEEQTNLKIYIKKASASAKKRTIRRR